MLQSNPGKRGIIAMKNRVIAIILMGVLCVSMFSGCGSTEVQDTQAESAAVEETTENVEVEGESELDALGDLEVDKGLFNVTLTIPKDWTGDVTQEELDETVKEKGYKSATLNSDGSVTYVMTKSQHKEMLDGIAESINASLEEMVGSEDYPNVTAVTANDDFTGFTITTKNEEPDLSESFAVMALYTYGGMYAIFSGEEVDNIHVDYVNDVSGEVISSANSSDMGDK
jgi:ABC-type Na+ efflux pump permease subunit